MLISNRCVEIFEDITMNKLIVLVSAFRNAIDQAKKSGNLDSDFLFCKFPHGCCRDTSYLLAEYLLKNDINTILYSADRDGYTHAWLVVKDQRVLEPIMHNVTVPDNINELINLYSGNAIENNTNDVNYRYEKKCFEESIIIDITGDQFDDYDESVYVGCFDRFRDGFAFLEATDFEGMCTLNEECQKRMYKIYETIMQYML